jgi:hypothetical protein
MPYKDSIKSIGGYRWGMRDFDGNMLSSSEMSWFKKIKLHDLSDEAAKAEAIGAKKFCEMEQLFATINYKIAIEKQKEWEDKKERISEIQRPSVPEVLAGHKWNQKIYGKAGNYSIYPDGDKVMITDEQAKEIKTYLAAKEDYQKKVEEIRCQL